MRIIRDGATPSPIDSRDYNFKDVILRVRPDILPKVDLRPLCQPIRNQGQQGSCTAFSSCGAREIILKQNVRANVTLSPAFVYYISRLEAFGNANKDSGCYLRSCMKTWQKYGSCLEKDFPYNDRIFAKQPSDDLIMKAKAHRINTYYRINNQIQDIKAALVLGLPVIIVIRTNLIAGITAQNGSIFNPLKNNSFTGLHAITIVGYYDNPTMPGDGVFVVRNSWDMWWGNNGYFHLPYKYVYDPKWFLEGWVMEG